MRKAILVEEWSDYIILEAERRGLFSAPGRKTEKSADQAGKLIYGDTKCQKPRA